MLAWVEVQTPYPLPDEIEARQLTTWVNQTLTFLQHQAPEVIRHRQAEMTIRIVDTAESQYLNTTWRHCSKPTNVLSFPFEAPPQVPLLGDLIVCAPLVAQEAQQQHKSLSAHWAHLIIHGTLHLLGYVHDTEPAAQLMESIEINILKELGYPNPYELIEV